MPLATLIERGQVKDLDLSGFVAVEATSLVSEVLEQMRSGDYSTALITEGDRLAGIFTERDILHKITTQPARLDSTVREWMTPNPDTVNPETNLLDALRLMNRGHYRDLPVVDGAGRLLGNVTDDSILWYLADRLQAEVINLPPDPDQVPKAPEGA